MLLHLGGQLLGQRDAIGALNGDLDGVVNVW